MVGSYLLTLTTKWFGSPSKRSSDDPYGINTVVYGLCTLAGYLAWFIY